MFARTERLILRPSWPEDTATLAGLMSQPDLLTNFATPDLDADPEAELILRQDDPRLPNCLAFMRTRRAPRLVGACDIVRIPKGGLELRFCVDRSHWGLGFATEMASAVVRIARATGLPTLEAAHFTDNPAAGRVLRKLGFRPTGRLEQRFCRARGARVPTSLYADQRAGVASLAGSSAAELYTDHGLVAA